jgi:hypothetical protein
MVIAVVSFLKKNPVFAVLGVALLAGVSRWFTSGFSLSDFSKVDTPLRDVGKTFPVQKAKGLASSLYSAMNVATGTDEDAIYAILKPLSRADFGAVYNAFGKRNYSRFFGEGGIVGISDKLDLIQWLREELTDDEILHVKKINPDLRDMF